MYISAQGPKDCTTTDFWRMIWEHHLFVVVMLTKEVENDKIKSARYWPEWTGEPNTLVYGNLQVTVLSRADQKDIVQRNLMVENLEDKEIREVVHIQYTGWLDHQAPPSVKSFMTMLHLVDGLNETAPKTTTAATPNNTPNTPTAPAVPTAPPICVHCSAGIGRSGTFCAIHMLYHFMRKHFLTNYTTPPINVVNTILQLRKQRPGMVQTKEQFVFVYQVIYEQYKKMKKEAEKRLKPQSDSNFDANTNFASSSSTTTSSATATATNATDRYTSLLSPAHSNGQLDSPVIHQNGNGLTPKDANQTPTSLPASQAATTTMAAASQSTLVNYPPEQAANIL